jgi:DNA-binding response OmpR family regulator
MKAYCVFYCVTLFQTEAWQLLPLSARKEQPVPEERGIFIDKASRCVWVDGKLRPGRLTKKECKLVLYLASRNGEICSREETVRAVYQSTYQVKIDDDRLDAVVGRARRKIEDNPRSPRFLITVNRHGHRLRGFNG